MYVADLGDNGLSSQDRYKIIYFQEPAQLVDQEIKAQSFAVQYPEGKAYNAEAVFFYGDQVYVMSKRWQYQKSNRLWYAPTPQKKGDKIMLEGGCSLPVGSGSNWAQITAVDVTDEKFMYRTYRKILEVPLEYLPRTSPR